MVDACMRCLLATGWLNFRMRCMLVSFAVYNLWLDWRSIAGHLARCFLDFDPGIHFPQLQMQAATTGVDMRCYSMTRQAKEHDPKGEFIMRYVPELSNLQGTSIHIHEPWRMKPPPPGYPSRIVLEDKTAKASKTTISAFQKQFQSGGPTDHMTAPLTQANASEVSGDEKENCADYISSEPMKGIKQWLTSKRPRIDTSLESSPAGALPWNCARCTLLNLSSRTVCEACDGPKPTTRSPSALSHSDAASMSGAVIDLD